MRSRILLACAAPILFAARNASTPDAPGELIVLLQSGEGRIERAFVERDLPVVQSIAGELGIPSRTLMLEEINLGAPKEIAITPLLLYQDHRGRSIYQGRLSTPERIRNFLRTVPFTSSRAGKAEASWRLERILLKRDGRVQLASPLKITALSGDRPQDHDDAAFEESVRSALSRGMEQFAFADSAEISRSDRQFYLDIHSHRSKKQELHVTFEIYSQFHCKSPVQSRLGRPVTGSWEQASSVYAEVGALFEKALAEIVSSPDGGDGFEPIPASFPETSWEALGLSLPKAPERVATETQPELELQHRWRIAEGDGGLSFHFADPLDGVRGEVRTFGGELRLGPQGALSGAQGHVEASVASITMGDGDLDHTIQSPGYLDLGAHPRALFRLEALTSEPPALAFGSMTSAVGEGFFEMKGHTVPLQVRCELEPILDEQGQERLLAAGTFELRIDDPFGLSGPGGPEPANSTLVFDFRFSLLPY